MSLGYYRLIKGKLIVRENQSPDGDSMRFIADNMSLFQGLPNYAPPSGRLESSYQLRFQAIDAPELHYGTAEQPYGLASRNLYLQWLGVDPAQWNWTVAPHGFTWNHPAAILCDGFDQHGRPIAFILKSSTRRDGADIKLTRKLLGETYNAAAVENGAAYVGMYVGGLSMDVENRLIALYKKAAAAHKGIWQLDQTALFQVTSLQDLTPPSNELIYPKIFRRCVDALHWAGGSFSQGKDLKDFLAAIPDENDQLVVKAAHGGSLTVRLSDVIQQVNNQIKISVDLNTVEFVSK